MQTLKTFIGLLICLLIQINTSTAKQSDTLKIIIKDSSYRLLPHEKQINNTTPDTGRKVVPFILSSKTLEKIYRPDSNAKYGDYIEVTIVNIQEYIKSIVPDKIDSVILYLKNIPMKSIHPLSISINKDTGRLVFQLNRKTEDLKKLQPFFYNINKKLKINISVGLKDKNPIRSSSNIVLRYVGEFFLGWTVVFCLIIVVFFVILAVKTSLIRSGDVKSLFSLGRSQLAFWTILIACSYFYIWAVTGESPVMPDSVLVLLGISIATKGSAFYIDYSKNITYYPPSKSFLADILSDENGINIHRAQMFLWTIILGFIYVYSVILYQKMYSFDTNMLALMGISSGTYVLLKTIENKKPELPTAPPPPPVGDKNEIK